MNSPLMITGASGFFGRSLLRTLQAQKFDGELVCVSEKRRVNLPSDLKAEWCTANLLDENEIRSLISKYRPKTLIHMAWSVPHGDFWQSSLNMDWQRASLALFSEFAKNGGECFVGAGTLVEYDISSGIVDESKTPLKPNTPYGTAKHELYSSLSKWRDEYAPMVSLIWPRIGYFFGEDEIPTRLFTKLIRSIRNGTKIPLLPAETKRPYAHVDRFSETLIQVLKKKPKTFPFSVTGPKAYSLKEMVDFIAKETGKSASVAEYGAYETPTTEPLTLEVRSQSMATLGIRIEDVFLSDLKKMIERTV